MNALFDVTLGAPSQSVATVDYATADGTANSANGDYVAITPAQTLTFNPNDPLTQQVSVTVNGDMITEADETFYLDLSASVGVTFVERNHRGHPRGGGGRFPCPRGLGMSEAASGAMLQPCTDSPFAWSRSSPAPSSS